MKFLIILVLILGSSNLIGQGNTIEVRSQDEIDNFVSNYPDSDTIYGNFYISGVINSFGGINHIKVVLGNLYIAIDSLKTPIGLDSLVEVQGSHVLPGNSNLMSFKSLEKLGRFGIYDFSASHSFQGYPALKEIGSVRINEVDSLISFEGLNNLEVISDEFEIIKSSGLANFIGLESMKEIGSFTLKENMGLINFEGLDSLEIIRDDFYLFDNANHEILLD